ncbi:MAG: 23S rRNA (guanosine(2251)-2'-O)-methyltransferase RlmB [Bacteroidota bacterium]|nr:23S rRNA (guanosine(2251)-2'-O)-methyltransferase RlmB [Bacteroidota bacterium]
MSFIYGIHPVMEALKSGKEFEKVLIQKGLKGEGFHQLHSLLRELEMPVQFVPLEKLNKLTRKNHQGVIGYLSEIVYQKIDDLIPVIFEQGRIPLILVLDHITDVRNFGAIGRTAECSGVDAIVVPSKGSALINADAVKTSAGALYKLPVCRVENLEESIVFLKNSGLRVIAATEKADYEYTKATFNQPAVLIMGSEETGISSGLLELADEKIRIPLLGEISSLNVSVAAGILLFEAVRQRKS